MATFILVHGAWHGGWCFEKITPLLQAGGHRVFAPDLPGHGEDHTPIAQVTLGRYVQALCDLIDTLDTQVILVGHSMGGIVISQVAEYRSEKIQKLIYLAAFMPKNNDSVLSLVQSFPSTRFSKRMKALPDENILAFPRANFKAFGYHLCDEKLFARIEEKFCQQPLEPMGARVKLSEAKFGSLPTVYIACLQDQAIHIASQYSMSQERGAKIFTLESDHSPFYSDPQGLAAILLQEGGE